MMSSSHLNYIFLFLLLVSCARILPSPQIALKQPEASMALEKSELKLAPELALEPEEKKNLEPIVNTETITKYCEKIQKSFTQYGWGASRCGDFYWNHVRNSVKGDPLMWTVFGDENHHKKSKKDLTLIMCGVHGDEITPIKFCFDIIYFLSDYELHHEKMVVVVPIVSPDSFFAKRPKRTNANGVDVNRNLPTKDWNNKARSTWINRYKRDARRNPGPYAMSEPETLFQVNLIKRYSPNKIISVHAPLTILDYDGPGVDENGMGSLARDLLVQMSEHAGGYRIKKYPFFPGSLGNYAGNERKIPTYTLELPSSDNRKHQEYWQLFRGAIEEAIVRDLRHNTAFK